MIIKNNKPKAAWFHYKIGGKIFKYQIPGNTAVDILDLTDKSQIVNNTYDRRIRHIEGSFGYNYETTFEVPGDPDFVTFSIISSVSGIGNISPLGLTKVAKGENVTYTMTAHVDENFIITAHTTNNSYGEISPSGNSAASTYIYYKLNEFLVDGNDAISAVTGTLTAATIYEFANVDTNHTVAASFSISSSTPSQIFTMSATSKPGYILTSHTTNDLYGSISPSGITSASNYYYLSSLIVDSTEKIGNVTGSTSATSTYNQVITANHNINPIFTYFQEAKTFEMTPEASTIVLTAITQGESGGTISPSGASITTDSYNYLSSFLVDSTEQISGITGDVSAMTTYNLTVSASHDVNPIFSVMSGSTTFTMTPEASYYLKSLFVDSVEKVGDITGEKDAVSTYQLQNILSGMSVEALFNLLSYTWQGVGGGLNDTVYGLEVFNGELCAAGSFNKSSGVTITTSHIAKFNGTYWETLGAGFNLIIRSIYVFNNELYAGGIFSAPTTHIAEKFNGVSWTAVGQNYAPASSVNAFYSLNNVLYAGGGTSSAGYVVKLNVNTWEAVGSLSDTVICLYAFNNELYAGGYFTSSIVKWNGSSWSVVGGGFDDSVECMCSFGNELYVGGLFTSASGGTITTAGIAKFNGTYWEPVGGGFGGGNVEKLYVFNNELYAGGSFSTASGGTITVEGLAKFNGTYWVNANGCKIDDYGVTYAMCSHEGELYIGGGFTTLSGGTIAAQNVAKLVKVME